MAQIARQIGLLIVVIVLVIVDGQPNPENKNKPALAFHTLPIYGNTSLGYYYVKLYMGSPAQEQTLVVDTGSNITTVPCTKCEDCGQHISQPFDSSKSSTAKFITCDMTPLFPTQCESGCKNKLSSDDPCKFTIGYGEGSTLAGVYLEDYVSFQLQSENQAVLMPYGCTTKESHMFYKQKANGILGLSPSRSYSLQKFFLKHSQTSKELLSLSVCLSKNGGFLSVGATNDLYHTVSPVVTKFITHIDRQFYTLEGVGMGKIGELMFHNPHMNIGPNGVFIDSGSTITYVPYSQYILLTTALDKICQSHSQCLKTKGFAKRVYHLMDDEQNQDSNVKQKDPKNLQKILKRIFPSITLQINNQIVQWKPSQYFSIYKLESRDVILGIDGMPNLVLGANWMVNKDIYFNLEAKTVEIYPNSKCSPNFREDQHLISEYLENGIKKQLTYIKKQLTRERSP